MRANVDRIACVSNRAVSYARGTFVYACAVYDKDGTVAYVSERVRVFWL